MLGVGADLKRGVVVQARAAFDEQKIAALGRAFRAGVTDTAKVDESLLVVLALGTLERPHIDVLHVIALVDPLLRLHFRGGSFSTAYP